MDPASQQKHSSIIKTVKTSKTSNNNRVDKNDKKSGKVCVADYKTLLKESSMLQSYSISSSGLVMDDSDSAPVTIWGLDDNMVNHL